MKTVTNQRNRKYVLDESTRVSGADGDSYKISGSSTGWVKLLYNTSKQTQLDIESRIRNGGRPEDGDPVEIVYIRGRFAGYMYSKEEIIPEPEPAFAPAPGPPQRRRSPSGGGFADFMGTAGGYAVAFLIVAVAFGVVQKFFLFSAYSGSFLAGIDPSVAQICYIAGITGIIAGVIVMLVFLKWVPRDNVILFIVLEAVAFLVGLLIIGFVLPAVVYAGLIAKALLPIIIIVIVVILFLKMRFRSKRRR